MGEEICTYGLVPKEVGQLPDKTMNFFSAPNHNKTGSSKM